MARRKLRARVDLTGLLVVSRVLGMSGFVGADVFGAACARAVVAQDEEVIEQESD